MAFLIEDIFWSALEGVWHNFVISILHRSPKTARTDIQELLKFDDFDVECNRYGYLSRTQVRKEDLAKSTISAASGEARIQEQELYKYTKTYKEFHLYINEVKFKIGASDTKPIRLSKQLHDLEGAQITVYFWTSTFGNKTVLSLEPYSRSSGE